MRSKKYHPLFYILLATCYLLLATFFTACGRRGDPVMTEPYKEIGVVKNLKGIKKEDGIYLTWGIPRDKDFPKKAIKSFIIMRAEVPVGIDSFREMVTVEECKCEYIPVDSIVPEWDKGDLFTYLDKKTIEDRTYAYKIVVNDKTNRLGKDSNIVIVGKKQEQEKVVAVIPEAPKGIIAGYTSGAVVLTWGEVSGARLYRIYRSIDSNDFILIKETDTPAFTDKGVEPSRKYYYHITAVGDSEGPTSEVIEVLTKAH